jgi:hypothetical protein
VQDAAIGLCSTCQHCRTVKGERSTFYLCGRSFTQPEYRKYPPLPVLRCPGYDPRSAGPGDGSAPSEDQGPDDKLTG